MFDGHQELQELLDWVLEPPDECSDEAGAYCSRQAINRRLKDLEWHFEISTRECSFRIGRLQGIWLDRAPDDYFILRKEAAAAIRDLIVDSYALQRFVAFMEDVNFPDPDFVPAVFGSYDPGNDSQRHA